jgi:hypothetical protein
MSCRNEIASDEESYFDGMPRQAEQLLLHAHSPTHPSAANLPYLAGTRLLLMNNPALMVRCARPEAAAACSFTNTPICCQLAMSCRNEIASDEDSHFDGALRQAEKLLLHAHS